MTVPTWQLRARFAVALAEMYGREVPAYTTLVEVSRLVNADHVAAHGEAAERLGSIDRVTAERHGAIRVGSPREMGQVARVFAAFGMHPVGFYDLRDASRSSVPVVSTAFRPVDPAELAKNPFRVFTSLLTTDDRRFFDAPTQRRLEEFIAARRLFGDDLLELADTAAAAGGLPPAEAERLLELATAAFRLSDEPVERDWWDHLERISSVAADIGGVGSTHVNHLTPRVLDIDDLYRRMQERGITMIDEVQGPPAWEGPDVLLRQTSFRALAEGRSFRLADGSIEPGELRVRFGEVEQRGIALTPRGRDLYDAMVAEVDRRRAAPGETRPRTDVARDVWRERLPVDEHGLAREGLAFFTFSAVPGVRLERETYDVGELLDLGALVAEPVVYEDFLPRSAAGIFQSNLAGEGTRDDEQTGTAWDADRLGQVIGRVVHTPFDLYAAQQDASLEAAATALGVRITSSGPVTTPSRR
ncbi:2-oxoadipate dioxygenase/decarboxylase [Kineococcus sp. SYSU DK003]|uniref:2-oxoadipate dioxygenase/decarboxylase n=1 Tax=Kineococcus sp. SYSU DK003 TaxID=3383124 RepID=UPI003D7F0EEA